MHVVGVWKALPLLKHNSRVYNFGNPTPFLLNSQVTFAMYILSTLLVLASSIVLYFYGHTRWEGIFYIELFKGRVDGIVYFVRCEKIKHWYDKLYAVIMVKTDKFSYDMNTGKVNFQIVNLEIKFLLKSRFHFRWNIYKSFVLKANYTPVSK